MLVIFEIVAFRNSRANKIIDIAASIIDDEKNIDTEHISLEAINSGESGYALILPEYVNNKKIDSYIITEKEIHIQETKPEETIEDNNMEFNNIQESKTDAENVIENEEIQENVQTLDLTQEIESETIITSSESTTIKTPGDTLYLTEEEVDTKQIELRVVYCTSQKKDQILYDQIIQTDVDDNNDGTIDITIIIEG